MDWESIVEIPAWSPLADVKAHGEAVVPNLYRIAEHAYLITEWCGRVDQDGTRVGADYVKDAVWACSDAAAIRCSRCAGITPESCEVIPPKLLLFGTNGTFTQLEALAPFSDWRMPVYNAPEGKVVIIGRLRYCFIEYRVRPADRPYAIHVSLFTEDARRSANYSRYASLNVSDLRKAAD